MSTKSRQRDVMLRVTADGKFEPTDDLSRQILRKRGLKVGDVVSANPKKPRNGNQWSRAHKLGQLLAENMDDFRNMEAHDVLKRIQYEADIGCEHMAVQAKGFGLVHTRWPKSLNYADMDETEFHVIYGQFCQHIIDTYWTGMTQEQIEQMANLVGLAA